MTIIEGLNALKAQGITKLVGMCDVTDIDTYLEHAIVNHENALKWGNPEHDDYVQSWKHSLDHENDNHMVETSDGHHIIVTTYGTADGKTFDMATYSDYDTEEEMREAFDEWKIARDAEQIADEMMVKRPNEFSHAAWVLIATSELRAANKAAKEAFEREFPKEA